MTRLPDNWAKTTLGEISSQGQYGWTTKASNHGQVRYLRTTDITSGQIDWETVPFCQETPPDIEYYKIKQGDIVISRAGSVGYSVLIDQIPSEPAVFASYLIRYNLSPELSAKFIARFFQSPYYWQQISDASAGIALANVNAKKLANVLIFLAPLSEQKRIVHKLDRILTRVDACQKHLERVPNILRRFRQSILAVAMSGKLTKEWREANRLEYNWQKVKFSDIGEIGRGKSKHRPRNDKILYGGKYPFIQTGDIAQSNGWITSHTQTYSNFGLAQSKLWPANTVCITIAANIANTAILSYPACFPDSVVGFIADHQKCLPQFVKWSIDIIKNDLETYAPATAQKNINLSILEDIRINCAPLDEQQEIVRRVESLFAYADQLEERWRMAQWYLTQITPSVLAKAFRGELIEKDPNDESAEKLLERIRMQRATQSVDKPRSLPQTQKTRETKMTEETVKAVIAQFPEDMFSFDDLRNQLPGDYEGLKSVVFNLLAESDAVITQVFDQSVQAMRFARRAQ